MRLHNIRKRHLGKNAASSEGSNPDSIDYRKLITQEVMISCEQIRSRGNFQLLGGKPMKNYW
jgi:hypothetical protein